MNSLPRISIVIPSFNKSAFIAKTLDSIVSQKYSNLEIIIQDGGSTDGTLEIIKKYAKKHSKIVKWESKKDNGQLDAINKGLAKATGDVLAFINADDVYKKEALSRVGEYFLKHPKAFWLAGRGDVIDRDGNEISRWATSYKNWLLAKNRYINLLMVNYLMEPSVFLSKAAYKKYGPLTGTKTSVMEYDLWLKLGKVEMPAVLNKTLSSFRMTNENISAVAFKKTLKEDGKIAEKYTTDRVVLLLHSLHNAIRVIWVLFFKSA